MSPTSSPTINANHLFECNELCALADTDYYTVRGSNEGYFRDGNFTIIS